MNIVEKKARKILIEGIETLSVSEKTNDVQLLVKYHNGQPEFFGMKGWETNVGHIPINDLYPAWQDIFGIRNQIPMFLANLINDISEENDLPATDINLLISVHINDGKKHLLITTYNSSGNIIKIMQFDEVFGEEAMMKMMSK